MLSSKEYYATEKGHSAENVRKVHKGLLDFGYERFVFLVGSSTLDNKNYVSNSMSYYPVSGYEKVLTDSCLPDICFYMNYFLKVDGNRQSCINCAIEDSDITERLSELYGQDAFIRDNISEEDTLVISVGFDEFTSQRTQFNMRMLLRVSEQDFSDRSPCYLHFKSIVCERLEMYIKEVTSKKIPKCVIICMGYYPCDATSKCNNPCCLKCIVYDKNPEGIKHLMKVIFEDAITKIAIPKVRIKFLSLYDVIDNKDEKLYTNCIYPSQEGGVLIARAINTVMEM